MTHPTCETCRFWEQKTQIRDYAPCVVKLPSWVTGASGGLTHKKDTCDLHEFKDTEVKP